MSLKCFKIIRVNCCNHWKPNEEPYIFLDIHFGCKWSFSGFNKRKCGIYSILERQIRFNRTQLW